MYNYTPEEEQHALPTMASRAPTRELYRQELKEQIRKMHDENGIVPILDWLNEVTRRLKELQREMEVQNLDILQEELRNFFVEKYPPFAKDKGRYVFGANIVRFNQRRRQPSNNNAGNISTNGSR